MKYECDCGAVFGYPDGPIHCADNGHGKGKPCPQCARFKAKLNREKMAKVIRAEIRVDQRPLGYDTAIADAIIKHLTE